MCMYFEARSDDQSPLEKKTSVGKQTCTFPLSLPTTNQMCNFLRLYFQELHGEEDIIGNEIRTQFPLFFASAVAPPRAPLHLSVDNWFHAGLLPKRFTVACLMIHTDSRPFQRHRIPHDNFFTLFAKILTRLIDFDFHACLPACLRRPLPYPLQNASEGFERGACVRKQSDGAIIVDRQTDGVDIDCSHTENKQFDMQIM